MVPPQINLRDPIAAVGAADERLIAHEGGEHALADIGSQVEQPLCLPARQPQARHFSELAANAHQQRFARRVIATVWSGCE